MMSFRQIARLVIALVLCLSSAASGATGTNDDLVTLYMPAFYGPGAIGQNVTTILNLQIWRTLRKAPTPNLKKLDFGRGLVVWDTQTLREPSFLSAEDSARHGVQLGDGSRVYPQLVLWGKARQFGDGVVVESFLSIPQAYAPSPWVQDQWEIVLPYGESTITVDADLPRRRYEFSAIALDDDVVKAYTTPRTLKIYESKSKMREIGVVGDKFEAQRHEGEWVLLTSDAHTGWVHLPGLSRNEVVDFVSGVIRIFRSDWDGAVALFDRVTKNPNTPDSLKADALLFEIMAQSKGGRDPHETIARAYDQAPYSRTRVIYSVMANLEQLTRILKIPGSEKTSRTLIARIRQEVENNRPLFPEADPWLATVTSFLESTH
jgi:hypothetical protein